MMTVKQQEQPITIKRGGNVLEIHVTVKLDKSDYNLFLPRIEASMKTHGKVRMLSPSLQKVFG